MRTKLLAGAVTLSCALISMGSHAATTTYYFDDLISGKASQAKSNFASLAVTPGLLPKDPWVFKLSAYDLALFGSYAFVGALAVDGYGKYIDVKSVKPGSGIKSVSVKPGRGPGSKFDFRFDLTGKRNDRLVDNEWVEWTVTGLSSIKSFGAHIQGIGPKGKDSAWYLGKERPTPVPLPATFWLVCSALAALFGGKRFWRRRSGHGAAAIVWPGGKRLGGERLASRPA